MTSEYESIDPIDKFSFEIQNNRTHTRQTERPQRATGIKIYACMYSIKDEQFKV